MALYKSIIIIIIIIRCVTAPVSEDSNFVLNNLKVTGNV